VVLTKKCSFGLLNAKALVLISDLFSALDRRVFRNLAWLFIAIILYRLAVIRKKQTAWCKIFYTIVILNFFGLIPGFFRVTVNPILVFIIGLTLFLRPLLRSVVNNYTRFLASLLPSGSPIPLAPFLVIIELISVLIRPVTLSLRLIANILAGHIVLGLLRRVSIVGTVLWTMFEFFVAGIQAYIFTLLVVTYTQ